MLLYDIYLLKKIIYNNNKFWKKKKKKIFCEDNNIDIKKINFEFNTLEYIKSINSFVFKINFHLKNENLTFKLNEFRNNNINNNVNIIKKISNKYLINEINENYLLDIHSYLYLNEYFKPFKYSIRKFSILFIENLEYLEGLNEIKINMIIMIDIEKLLKELYNEKTLKLSMTNEIINKIFKIKFQTTIPLIFINNIQKFLEGIEMFFKTNNFYNVFYNKTKKIQIKTITISEKIIKIKFEENNKFNKIKNLFYKKIKGLI